MRRTPIKNLTIAGSIVGLVLVLAVPALAKGAGGVTLTSGDRSVVFESRGLASDNSRLGDLVSAARLYEHVWSDPNGPHSDGPPEGDLGEMIEARWAFIGPADDIVIVQYLYPHAEVGPVGHIPGGQAFLDDTIADSWFALGPDVIDALLGVGFVPESVAQAAIMVDIPRIVRDVGAAETDQTATRAGIAVTILGGVGLFVAISTIMRRRNERTV